MRSREKAVTRTIRRLHFWPGGVRRPADNGSFYGALSTGQYGKR